MGRPGTGGGGGHSSGGHSSSRSSGGHHVGSSSSRPTGGSSYNSSRGGSYNSYRMPHYNSYNFYYPRGPRMGSLGAMVMIVIMLCVFFFSSFGSTKSNVQSTINRTKIENPTPYKNECIVDEMGWITNQSRLSKDLQKFYNKTGIQPYIYLKDYDDTLETDLDKNEFANQYYDEYIDNEDTFLYIYFADSNPDEIGYMSYVNGKQVTSVMDQEAVNIFWSYIDRYWTDSSLSMDEVIEKSFNETATTIMKVSTTTKDIIKYVVIGIIVIGAGVCLVVVLKNKHKRDAEKAAEDQKILNTKLDDSDDLKDKYL